MYSYAYAKYSDVQKNRANALLGEALNLQNQLYPAKDDAIVIDNVFVRCNYCKTKLRFRFQMGYFDIPFDICCPTCGIHISGLRKLEDEPLITVDNATIFSGKPDEADYYADFSVELPHAKIAKYESLEKLLESGFSPFMMTINLYGHETYLELVKRIRNFLSFKTSIWPQLRPLFDLFANGKINLAKDHFLNLSSRFAVENELDGLMALHQTTVLGMNSILPNGTLNEFMNAAKQINSPNIFTKLDNFFALLGGKDHSIALTKRLVNIYDRWMNDFEKYIPAVMLSLGNATEKFDKVRYGIATTSYEDMKTFYSDSYELILDYIGIAIGLNNIIVRGDCNAFPSNTIRVNKTTNCVSSFIDYLEIVKSSRLSLLVEDEPFGKAIPLNRNIRNAIAHFDYDFDSVTQKFTFRDKYRNKDACVELYLVDLALLCYDNMTMLAYFDELLYDLCKISYVNEGMLPHIKSVK